MPMPEHIKEKVAKLKKGEKVEIERKKTGSSSVGQIKKEVQQL